jgi:uncharacterized protein (DUF1800 family)
MREKLLIPYVLLLATSAALSSPATFLTKECEYRLGESLMIPLKLDTPTVEKFSGSVETSPPGIIEVLRPPEFLAGNSIGFARIRTLKPGTVTMQYGTSQMRIRVTSERPLAMVRQMRPRFTSPSEGSHVWGTIAIGAEMWVGAPGVDRDKTPDVKLNLPDGRTLKPDEAFPPVDGPFWRLVFNLDTSKLPPGDCVITISATPPVEGAGKADVLTSEPHTLHILPQPSGSDIVASGECEDALETPRAERMGLEPPGVIMDPNASHYRAVALRRNRPAWVIQPEIKNPGRYQLMMRARGTIAGSAYPSLGIILGQEATDSVSVRLASATWHEVPVGRPVKLEAGTQWIGVTLANEFSYRNQLQRTAEIDSYSLRRVPDATSADASMMMAGGMMMESNKNDGDKNQTRANNLRTAFTTLADGHAIRGRTTFLATLTSPSLRNERDYARIRSDLWINGKISASAHGQNPSFTVHAHDFKKGENTLQIHSVSPCGNQALSLTQAILADSPNHPTKKLETTYQTDRYDLQRGSWKQIERTEIKADHPLAGENAATHAHVFKPKRTLHFDIPQHFQGERRLSLHTRAIPGTPPGIIAVKLHQPDAKERSLREIKLPPLTTEAAWTWHPLASIDLANGRKWLTFELIEGEAAIAGCSIDTQIFVDAAPPSLAILYPRPDANLSADGDALVLRSFDDLALSHFELYIDGKKSPLPYPAGTGTGPILLPIPSSLLEPGARRIEVDAIDESGKTTRTPPINIQVRKESGPSLTLPYPRAIRLAKNIGLGIDSHTLISILSKGESAWLEQQLSAIHPEEPLVDALAAVWFRDGSDYNIRGRVAAQLLATRFPVRARFTQFAQNHFSTWMSKTGATAKWREHQAFHDVGPARFQDLLLTSATSPAMMVYLDQQNSFGRQLNENYARELMELHTVGVHAGYQQNDVIHLAKLLSGWGAQREATMDGMTIGYEYRYSPYLAEPGPLEVFGLSIPAAGSPDTADDRVRLAIEMLAARPQTARFFSEKLAAHYLGEPADESTVAALESEFLNTGGNLRGMISLLATSPALMATDRPEKIMPPVEFAVASQRAASSTHPWSVINLADRSGRNLFDRASPDGFPEANDEYADSNYQLQKWRFCKEIEWQLRGTFPSSAFTPDALADESQRNSLIDLAYATRSGTSPSATSRVALHQILDQPIPDDNQRRNLFTSFLHMMPEFQSR